MTATMALVRFKLAAYARSHRLLQPLFALVCMLAIFYGAPTSPGGEPSAYADAAGLLVIVFAWAARSLLDTEPPTQRLISMTSAGGPGREVAAGLAAALMVDAALAAIAVAVPLAHGFVETPSAAVIAQGAALHGLAVLVGIGLGALSSAQIIPSPAASMFALLGGFVGLLLLSITPAGPLLVPIVGWMRAAGDGALGAMLPALALPTVLWSCLAVLLYVRLRRTRP
ncbi:hypothetical protein Misp01_00370 [Microtetraspora sp. NBRC 13810]|uniref:hypothetical protein n=1 Tax=Microtetraspora sp. NBRC 13810 TaxID=3030990 RepID=UPI0024A47B9C|nr:hypothetical protein [Microtetraspora sp. NBRC 13810]GLW04907.1 hypothetical protein Misp01_00370 [Microtetraspora sp. NBRC 13810]